MLDMDPPRHDELRGLIARRFTPRAVHVWEDQVRRVTREVLDRALPMGEFDFVQEVSSEIPMQVFAEILGVPQDERREIIELGDRLLGNQDPEYAVEPEEAHKELPFSSPAALEMFEFGRRLAAERRKQPGDDIITQLAFEPLAQQDFDNYFVLLATAGNETTRHTITHGLLALLEHPEEMERLRDDPALGKTRGRGDAALGHAGAPLPAHGGAGHRAGRHADQGGRQGDHLVRVGQPRRGRVRGARPVRPGPHAEPPHGVRPRRHPPLHGRAPGARWRCGSRSRSCSRA